MTSIDKKTVQSRQNIERIGNSALLVMQGNVSIVQVMLGSIDNPDRFREAAACALESAKGEQEAIEYMIAEFNQMEAMKGTSSALNANKIVGE